MASLSETAQWIGHRVDDVYGARVGRIDDVYADANTGEAQWILVRLNRFNEDKVLVPLDDTISGAGHVWVPYERELIRATPRVSAGAPLAKEQELQLCAAYSLGPARFEEISAYPDGSITLIAAGGTPSAVQQ